MRDWMIRAVKTFVQAFFGVLIPVVCAVLAEGFPESWVILAPSVSAALSAAIAAVWNLILERLSEGDK